MQLEVEWSSIGWIALYGTYSIRHDGAYSFALEDSMDLSGDLSGIGLRIYLGAEAEC